MIFGYSGERRGALKVKEFIENKIAEIKKTVGDESAISALSGGVDSSACTILAHRAIGGRLKVIFIDDGLMREGEPRQVQETFGRLGILRSPRRKARPGRKKKSLPPDVLQRFRPRGQEQPGLLSGPRYDCCRYHRNQRRR
jgi:hypothetical protein